MYLFNSKDSTAFLYANITDKKEISRLSLITYDDIDKHTLHLFAHYITGKDKVFKVTKLQS